MEYYSAIKKNEARCSREPTVHSCNPRYSGGSHHEDHSLRPAVQKKVSKTKLISTNKLDVVVVSVIPAMQEV
jgi:hypothetical protein